MYSNRKNNYAISTNELATSLTSSASALELAGNSLEQSVALLTGGNTILQDPDVVSTSLKVISLRIRGVTSDLQEMGESVDDVVNTSKLQAKIKALTGVDIVDASGAFRSTYDILVDIGKVYNELDSMSQSGVLELLAGKQRANALGAILTQIDTVENAYTSAMESDGSATAELEKYIDSIQGKIDQFNNAVQSMWSNTLDSNLVKGFVGLGTTIIKIIDKIGVLKTALIAVATISMIKNKMGPITFLGDISDIIRGVVSKVGSFIGSLTGMTAATSAYTAETLAASVANSTLSASEAAIIATKNGLALATTSVTAAEATEMLTRAGVAKADALAMVAKLGLTSNTQVLTLADIQAAVASGTLTLAQGAQIASALGLTEANKDLAASAKTLWTAMWPVLAVMLAIAAVVGVVKLFDAMITTTSELKEELDELNTEISEIESELDFLNSELETTQDRMRELLSMDSLSFTEEEELKNLKLKNAELERQIKLQEAMLKAKEEDAKNKTKEVIDKTWNNKSFGKEDYAVARNGTIVHDGFWLTGKSGKEALDESISKYQELKEKNDTYRKGYIEALEAKNNGESIDVETYRQLRLAQYDYMGEYVNFENWQNMSAEDIQTQIDRDMDSANDWTGGFDVLLYYVDEAIKENDVVLQSQEQGINMVLKDMSDIITENGLSYSMGDEEINKFLDEYYAYSVKWANAQGSASKSSVISAIWDNTESEPMAELKKDLEEIANSDSADKQVQAQKLIQDALDDTTGKYERLKTFMSTVGVTAEEMALFFISASEGPDIGTIEGINEVYQDGIDILGKYKDARDDVLGQDENGEDITWNNLFTEDEDGKKVADTLKIAAILEGSDEAIQEKFARMVEAVENGEMSVDEAFAKWNMSGFGKVLDNLNNQFESINNEMFAGVADEINGLIDTVNELQAALEDVASTIDLLSTAEEQMANSGQISVKTALDLMATTDDYSKVVTVQNGVLKLASGAQEYLTQVKFNSIKAQLEASATLAENTYQTALASNTELDYADNANVVMTAESIKAEAIGRVSAVVVALGAAMDEIQKGNWGSAFSAFGSTYTSATATVVAQSNAMKTSIAALEQDAKNKRALADVYSFADDYESFKDNYDFDKTPGDKYDDDSGDDEDDAFQRAMDYWENRIGANQARYEQIQNEIDLLEAKGQKAGAKYYQEQIKLENQRLDLLTKQKAEAQSFLGTFAEGSDEWWEVANTLNDIESELDDVTASIQDLNDAMADTHWYIFDEAHDRLSTLTSDLENIRDILSNEKLFDDEGNFTKEGLGTLASYVQELGIYEGAMADARKEMELFGEAYDPNKTYVDAYGNNLSIDSEQDWYEAAEKAEEKYDEWNQKVIETKYNIKDLYEQQIDAVEEYTDTLVDSYNDYIDSVKEALDAERDLYDFKRKIEDQSRSVAETERKIAALSGSTNAADIAERRRLEATLYDQKRDLDDSYRDHSQQSTQTALDDEANAYEEAMNRFIESLWTKLEESTSDLYLSYDEMGTETKSFVDGVTQSVVLNAGNVKEAYLATGETIDDCLVTPWTNAADAIGAFSSSEGALGLMNSWTESKAGAPFYDFQTKVSGYLSKPWSTVIEDGGPVTTFKASVNNVMSQIVSDVKSNVSGISGVISNLQTEINKIKDTTIRITTVYQTQGNPGNESGNESGNGSGNGSGNKLYVNPQPNKTKTPTISSVYGLTSSQIIDLGYGPISLDYFESLLKNYEIGLIRKNNTIVGVRRAEDVERTNKKLFGALSGPMAIRAHAKGTMGTTRDEWAITDESWIGEEITLAAGKSGRLRGMMKGSAVLPSDISENLVEWGKLNPDEMHFGNAGNNYVNSPTNDVDVANSLTIDGHGSSAQGVHDSIRDTYELIEDTVESINNISQHYKPSVDEALTTPWIDATGKVDEFNAAVNANYDGVISHIDGNKEHLEIALSTPYSNVTDDINDFSQHAQKASVDDVVTHANEQSQALTTALSTGFNNAKTAADALKNSGTNAVNAVEDSFTNAKTGLIKALNDATSAAQKTKQAIDNVPTYSDSNSSNSASVQAGQHYISSLGKNVTLSSNVVKWSSIATQALQKTGQYSYDNLLLLLHQMQTESSGNQNALNNWDSNAKNGTPSKGLMQVIDPTFQAYAMKGYDKDIYDPLSNIIAAIRYTTSRYGSLAKGWRGSGYAKGTTGTSKDEWAITDEFGPELTMYATPEGTLSFMRAGSTVVPANITANLVEWGKLNPDMLNVNKTPNINMISNAVNKPELNITFDSLVKAENITEETLPAVRKLVTQELNRFTKELNYALKCKGAR